MEDTFKFLLVAAVIAIGLVRQLKQSAKESAEGKTAMPRPTAENPLPENWGGGTFEEHTPEAPKPKAAPPAYRHTASSKPQAPPPSESQEAESDGEPSEFSIRSAEEARRAVIWSEILRRKY